MGSLILEHETAMPSHSAPSSAPAASPTVAEERRAFPRYPVDWEVVCKALAAGQRDSWQARALNVSAGGLGVVLERRFERGTTLTVQLQHAPAEAPRTLLARVMHATRLPDGGWLHGLSLLRPLQEEQLRAWGVGPARPERPDSRAWVRLACAMDALCAEVGGGAAPWRGQVLDLSPSGLGLASTRAVETGSHLTIDLRPARGQAARRLLVRVAHVKQQDEGTWLLGCEFTQQLSEADLTALAEPADDGEEVPGAVEPSAAGDTAVTPVADPDLARLCAAWPALPARTRAAILALLADAR
ncbi:MAG TPA: PilZ domain-containing protein [Gemmataceae bacterium]|nr:PilZ domain-containing protein [Gemmataceae bacterium]